MFLRPEGWRTIPAIYREYYAVQTSGIDGISKLHKTMDLPTKSTQAEPQPPKIPVTMFEIVVSLA